MNWALTLNVAQLVASIATAAGVIFAGFQFILSRRAERARFTIKRLDRLRAHFNEETMSKLRKFNRNELGANPDKLFNIYLSKEWSHVVEAEKEFDYFMALLMSGQFSVGTIHQSKFMENLRYYAKTIHHLHLKIDAPTTAVERSKKYTLAIESYGKRFGVP